MFRKIFKKGSQIILLLKKDKYFPKTAGHCSECYQNKSIKCTLGNYFLLRMNTHLMFLQVLMEKLNLSSPLQHKLNLSLYTLPYDLA